MSDMMCNSREEEVVFNGTMSKMWGNILAGIMVFSGLSMLYVSDWFAIPLAISLILAIVALNMRYIVTNKRVIRKIFFWEKEMLIKDIEYFDATFTRYGALHIVMREKDTLHTVRFNFVNDKILMKVATAVHEAGKKGVK